MEQIIKNINSVVKDFKQNLGLDLVIDFDCMHAKLKKDSPRSRLGFKTLWAYRFKDTNQMLKFFTEQYNIQISFKDRKAAEKIANKERLKKDFSEVKVGDIFLCSWGYEQTNVDFYKLIELKGTKGIFQEVGYNHVRETSWCSAEVEVDETQIIGEPFVKMIKGSSFKKYQFASAYKVDKNRTFYKSWGY